ncbi:MAG: DUF5058 family protein [Clostridia bacterium]|nr:DUF5058 family protein [Clostridia bacterium]
MPTFDVNSGFLYGVTTVIILFVIAQSVFFLVRATRRAKQLGITGATIRSTILSSAIFTVAPAIAILMGVITLSKMLGLPWPWLRLSILGALTYELPAATTTAAAMGVSTSTTITDPHAFTAIAWVMTLGIIPGIFLILFGLKKLEGGLHNITGKDQKWGKLFMDSMFLGMISAFLGLIFADVREGLPGYIPLVVALISALLMCLCGLIIKVFKAKWLEQYALPLCMLGAMAASIPVTALMK